HEKRASIYVPPVTTDRINEHMAKVRARGELLHDLDQLKRRIDEGQVQADLFDSTDTLQERVEQLERTVDARGLQLRALQEGLSDALAPYVVRRQRDCIGESATRSGGDFRYPPFRSHRRDADLTAEQRSIIL